jgi:hypothetical protein
MNAAIPKQGRLASCRHAEGLVILTAIREAVPSSLDVDGQAAGIVATRALSLRAGVSGKGVSRALKHWQRSRVLWLRWKGKRTWEVRFERGVVDELLAETPREIGRFLMAHKRRREAESAARAQSIR